MSETSARADLCLWSRRHAAAAAVAALGAACLGVHAAPTTTTPYIRHDQFGYLTGTSKVAVIVDPQSGYNAAEAFTPGTGASQYQIRRWSDNAVVYSGTLSAWKSGATHGQSGDRGWYFDFSSLDTAGSYYIYDTLNNVGSGRFEIGPNVYDNVLRQAMRVFYYQRLNLAKVTPYAESKWTDGATYERAGQDRSATSRWAKGVASTARDLSGGWMDAGDTNKYTTFAQSAVLQLLDAYRASPAVFGDSFGIPESGNGISDLLDELKWELDFLKKMQDGTGTSGLFLKIGVDDYNDVTPLSADARPRYYVPECTSATLAGSAMFASASRVYSGVPALATYGADLLTRAEAAWARAKVTTSNFTTFETGCDDGNIKAGDADVDQNGQISSALIAAVYLYDATGKAEYKTFVESRYASVEPMSANWWGPYTQPMQAALLRYAAMPGVTASVASAIRTQKTGQNGVMSITDFSAGTDLYRSYLPDAQYHWGHNMVRANTGNINLDFASFGLNAASAATYRDLAQQHLHWLHGANPRGLVMLSNMAAYGAESSINEIYHTWFRDGTVWDNALTSTNGPAPGYVTGGPNKSYGGPVAGITDQPPQKAYKDWNTGWPDNSWELSEPAIYSQAAYVQLLARLMNTSTGGDTQPPTAPTLMAGTLSTIKTTGSTSTSTITAKVTWKAATDNVGVTAYDLYNGTTLLATNLTGTSTTLTSLKCGTTYTLTLRARDAAGNVSNASNTFSMTTTKCPLVVVAGTVLYDDALGANWADWSWSATRDFASTAQVKVGTKSARFDLQGWGGLSLRHTDGIVPGSTTALTFWAYAPVATPLLVYIQTQDSSAASGNANCNLPAATWTSCTVSLAQMGNPSLIKRINIQLNSATAATVYFDQIVLTK